MARVRPSKRAVRVECTLLSRRTVCKSDASLSTSHKESTAPRVHSCALARVVQLSTRTRDDRDKSNFVSAVPELQNPLQFSLPNILPVLSFTRDSPSRCESRHRTRDKRGILGCNSVSRVSPTARDSLEPPLREACLGSR